MAGLRSNGEDYLGGGSRGDVMSTALPKKHPTLSFVVISDPAQTKNPAARRLVRSQAAKQSQSQPTKPPSTLVPR